MSIVSWHTLLRQRVALPWLGKSDLWLGTRLPFNRVGWNVIVLAERRQRLGGRR